MVRYIGRGRFEEMDRSTLPLAQVSGCYYTALRTEGKTVRTVAGYEEKLGRFIRWHDATVGELTLKRGILTRLRAMWHRLSRAKARPGNLR
jgi:hypothetical protein